MAVDSSIAGGGRAVGAPVSLDDAPLNAFHRKLTLFSSGGPFLDGYILAIIGIALVQAVPALRMDTLWTALIGASALVGVFLGGLLFGPLTDRIGRKLMYMIDLGAIVVFSILQFFVTEDWQLGILRLLIGVAVGADYPIATALVAEFAPSAWRARLLGGLNAMWFVGATVAAFVGFFLLDLDDGWRWMLVSSAVPAVIIMIGRTSIPESPRWLASKGRTAEAQAIVVEVLGEGAVLEEVPPEESTGTLLDVVRGGYLKRVVFISIFWSATVITLFAIYAFGPQMLALFGLQEGRQAELGYGLINLFFLVGNIIALVVVERLGRRPVLIGGFALSALGLLYLAVFPESSLLVVAIAFAVYAIFNGGPSILEWIYPNELFPTEIRASAVGLCTATSRIGAAIGTFATPWALAELGIGTTMYIATAVALVGAVVSYFMAPETKGKTLRESARL